MTYKIKVYKRQFNKRDYTWDGFSYSYARSFSEFTTQLHVEGLNKYFFNRKSKQHKYSIDAPDDCMLDYEIYIFKYTLKDRKDFVERLGNLKDCSEIATKFLILG